MMKDDQINEGNAVEFALDSVVWSQGELLKASEINGNLWEDRYENQKLMTERQRKKKVRWAVGTFFTVAVLVGVVVFGD